MPAHLQFVPHRPAHAYSWEQTKEDCARAIGVQHEVRNSLFLRQLWQIYCRCGVQMYRNGGLYAGNSIRPYIRRIRLRAEVALSLIV